MNGGGSGGGWRYAWGCLYWRRCERRLRNDRELDSELRGQLDLRHVALERPVAHRDPLAPALWQMGSSWLFGHLVFWSFGHLVRVGCRQGHVTFEASRSAACRPKGTRVLSLGKGRDWASGVVPPSHSTDPADPAID